MICHNCGLRTICKIYDVLTVHAAAIDVSLSSCTYCRSQKEMAATVEIKNEPIPELSLEKALDPNRVVEMSEKIKSYTNPPEKKPTPTSPSSDDEDDDRHECNICHVKEGPGVELTACDKCGEAVCYNCATETVSGYTLCDSCYDKYEPS